jgi:hypothetical protein
MSRNSCHAGPQKGSGARSLQRSFDSMARASTTRRSWRPPERADGNRKRTAHGLPRETSSRVQIPVAKISKPAATSRASSDLKAGRLGDGNRKRTAHGLPRETSSRVQIPVAKISKPAATSRSGGLGLENMEAEKVDVGPRPYTLS